MRKRSLQGTTLVTLAALAVTAGCGGTDKASGPPKPRILEPVQLASQLQRQTVQILGREGNDDVGGSGIVLDAGRGLVLTNEHVVAGTSSLHVWHGQDSVTARVIGSAPCSDLAVVKMTQPITGLRAAKFAKTAKTLAAGVHVTALGYPGGPDGGVSPSKPTLSDGVVSSPGVISSTPDPAYVHYNSLVQHSAPINPGDSGGPLANDFGLLVAVNTLAGGQNHNYSISVDEVKGLLDDLERGKKTGYVGWDLVPTSQMNQADRDAYKWSYTEKPEGTGLAVKGVDPGSPADRHHFQEGDYIWALNGTEVNTVADVCDIVASQENQIVKVGAVSLYNGKNYVVKMRPR
jgi:S1-C subfamily serine protease